jgi:hypothetical protein
MTYYSNVSLVHFTTGKPLTYVQARAQLIKKRTSKSPKVDKEQAVDADDFEPFQKGLHKFSIPVAPYGMEFLDLVPSCKSTFVYTYYFVCMYIHTSLISWISSWHSPSCPWKRKHQHQPQKHRK